MSIEIYYDSMTEATWFESLNPEFSFSKCNYNLIKRRGQNPDIIENITLYDKPDIIVLSDSKPILVLETTQEVPTGHNVGQRFARLARAVELHIPTIYYFPFDAKKHGKYSGMCNLNIRLLRAAKNIREIHNTPLLCLNWITDEDGEIIVDGRENLEIKRVLASYVDSNFNSTCSGFIEIQNKMEEEYARRLSVRPSYGRLPNSVQYIKTDLLIKERKSLPRSILDREYSYVYTMDMAPEKCKRQDPYTGTAVLYDYLLCRTGNNVADKSINLILNFPRLTLNLWKEKNPNNLDTKSSNWYLSANIILLKDGFIVIRG